MWPGYDKNDFYKPSLLRVHMKKPENIDNAVSRLSGEHKLIADYAARFARGRKEHDQDFFSRIGKFAASLKKDMVRHFELEELVFFPAAVNAMVSYETTLAVLNFQKEHGILEKELEYVLALEDQKASGNMNSPIIESLSLFLEKLKVHARRELVEIFPLIDSNSDCRKMVSKYLQESVPDL
jgi:hemerythrin-like domain-containing protein